MFDYSARVARTDGANAVLMLVSNLIGKLFGDERLCPLEHRLFNTIALFGGVALTLFLLEQYRPKLFTQYATSTGRFHDVAGNFLFV